MWHVYLGSNELAVFAPDGAARQFESPCDVAEATTSAFESIAKTRRFGAKPCVAVWLSGELARPFVLEPLVGLRSWYEAQAYALAIAPDATGFKHPSRPFIEGWPAQRPVLAVVAEESTMTSIHKLAAAHRLRIKSIRPWWTLALASLVDSARTDDVLIAEEGEALTLLVEVDGCWSAAATVAPKPPAGLRLALDNRLRSLSGSRREALHVVRWEGALSPAGWPCAVHDRRGAEP